MRIAPNAKRQRVLVLALCLVTISGAAMLKKPRFSSKVDALDTPLIK